MWKNIESKTSCEKPKVKPEIAETFNWSKEERQKLKEDFLVWELRKKLIEKYPEQKCFFETAIIKVMQLGKNIEWQQKMVKELKTNIFLLYSPEWNLLSYLDQNWNTMFDISNFDFDEDFWNLLNKKVWNLYIRKNKTWNLELFDPEENKIHSPWSPIFNTYIFAFYLKTINR